MANDDQQSRVIDFLKSPAAWAGRCGPIDCIETHGALVFLCGDLALKIRRAVRFSYMDYSTLGARRRLAEREFELNKPHAPDLYRRVAAITESDDGTLALDGAGNAVEWALEMARFPQSDLLSAVVEAGGIDDGIARSLAEAVQIYHAAAPQRPDALDRVPKILQSVMASLGSRGDGEVSDLAARLLALGTPELDRCAAIRADRRRDGYIRRCHGDLHLGNIVLWRGKPTPFDAIEFDEAIATIDTLYDLAFLLMDLWRRGAHRAANILFNQYLWRTGDARDLAGLAAMPLYLALRAAIRAMVTLDRAALGVGDLSAQRTDALAILAEAEHHLQRKKPMLLAIGGLSGTGKTTLGRTLAPSLWPTPGAIHLRSDLERKWSAGVAETARLPSTAYTSDASRIAYARVTARAEIALAAGHSVIVDAVFATPAERAAIEALAARAQSSFRGLWLSGQADELKARVAARTSDASDATPEVVEKQLGYDLGLITWATIDCSDGADAVATRARTAIGL